MSIEGTRLYAIDTIDFKALAEYIIEKTSSLEDVSFKGGKSAADTYAALKDQYLKDLVKLFKWMRVRGDQLQKPARGDMELASLIGGKFSLWSKSNSTGNSTLMIKILWAPIWGRICNVIKTPVLAGIDLSKVTGLFDSLKWPGYLAIVPVTSQYKGAIKFHTYFTQLYIKMRAKKRNGAIDNETLISRANKQAGFQKALVRALSETTKNAYFTACNPKNELRWEVPQFGSNSITDEHDSYMEECITAAATMEKEKLFEYLIAHNMYGVPN